MNSLQDWARERAELAQGAAAAVVAVEDAKGRSLGGIVWDGTTVVTAAEGLARGAVRIRTATGDVEGEVAAADRATDVAILRLPATAASGLGGARHGDSAALQTGQPVLLAARDDSGPLVLWTDLLRVGPAWRSSQGGEIARSIHLATRIHGRFEGAGLFDVGGRLCAMVVPGPRRRGLGIPVETIAGVVARVAQHGYLPQPYLGVRLQPVWIDESQAAAIGRGRGPAVIVTGVESDSPAHRAGLVLGDFILALGAKEVGRPAAIAREIGAAAIGSQINFEVLRAGSRQRIAVAVGEQPRA